MEEAWTWLFFLKKGPCYGRSRKCLMENVIDYWSRWSDAGSDEKRQSLWRETGEIPHYTHPHKPKAEAVTVPNRAVLVWAADGRFSVDQRQNFNFFPRTREKGQRVRRWRETRFCTARILNTVILLRCRGTNYSSRKEDSGVLLQSSQFSPFVNFIYTQDKYVI